ncbi:ABC transporter permease [Bacillaceae bacterium S4-13-56]
MFKFDATSLWKERLVAYGKEISRYLRYMFNGHIAVVLFFLISALAFYYQQWLMQIPENFPAAWVIALSLGLVATNSSVRTFIKEPDLVFIIPAESKMGPYFRSAIMTSFFMQLYLVILIGAALAPLFFATLESKSLLGYLPFLVVVILFKAWNLLAGWWVLYSKEKKGHYIDLFLRYIVTTLTFYFIVQGASFWFPAITTLILWFLMMYNYLQAKKQVQIPWELLVEKETAKMQTFYRIANLFTDVPHVKKKLKRRAILSKLAKKGIGFNQENTFDFLFRISFVRSSDYLGMFVRLVVVGGLVIFWMSQEWAQLLFAILFLYITGFQMLPLIQHHRVSAWMDLYPVPKDRQVKAVQTLAFQLLIIQTILFGILALTSGNIMGAVLIWVGGGLFTYLFVYVYAKTRLKPSL